MHTIHQRDRQRRFSALTSLAVTAVFAVATLIVALTLPAAAATGDAATLATMLASPERYPSAADINHMTVFAIMFAGFLAMSVASVAFWRGLVTADRRQR